MFESRSRVVAAFLFDFFFLDQVHALAQSGCDVRAVNAMGHSGLSQAAAYGNTVTLNAMLQVGADVLQYTPSKRMGALFRACYNGHASCARALIDHKADVDITLADGTSCCYVAAEKGHCDVLRLLIDAGAAFDVPDTSGVTPLWRAADRGCAESVRVLIQARANVDVLSNDGKSVLHASACNGHAEVVAELIAAGADTWIIYQGPPQVALFLGMHTCTSFLPHRALSVAFNFLNFLALSGMTAESGAAAAGNSTCAQIIANARKTAEL